MAIPNFYASPIAYPPDVSPFESLETTYDALPSEGRPLFLPGIQKLPIRIIFSDNFFCKRKNLTSASKRCIWHI
jgi:hypothetical protein